MKNSKTLMIKPEIQPLVPLVSRVLQVIQPLRVGHGIPLLVSRLIAPDIVPLHGSIENQVHAADGQQLFVSPSIQGRIVLPIDIRRDNSRRLHHHVVRRSRHRSGPDRVRVARVPSNLDRVGVGKRQQEADDGKDDPSAHLGSVDSVEVDEEWQDPDLCCRSEKGELMEDFGKVGDGDHGDDYPGTQVSSNVL